MNISLYNTALSTAQLGRTFSHLAQIDSTSTYLKHLRECVSNGYTVFADEQLSGRGRTGNTFFSPKNGLYMSVLLTDECYTRDVLFTLKVCLAVCRAVDSLAQNNTVGIKWVNDIYCNNRKLCGILSEATLVHGKNAVLLGIGINMHLEKSAVPSALRHKICDMKDVAMRDIEKEILCAKILNEIEHIFHEGMTDDDFIKAYKARSVILGKKIIVTENHRTLTLTATDFSPTGALIATDEQNVTHTFSSGEIHVKFRA